MIYTIGHSNYSAERFVEILKTHGIEMVVDVRGVPYSKHVPHFNRESLRGTLEKAGFEYRFAGKYLGNKGEISDDMREKGIDGLLKYGKKYKVAIMCSEKDYRKCHRNFIITKRLLKRGEKVVHIVEESLVKASMSDFSEQTALF